MLLSESDLGEGLEPEANSLRDVSLQGTLQGLYKSTECLGELEEGDAERRSKKDYPVYTAKVTPCCGSG